ncbi:uncharacterized protein Dana_GF26244 [Drosophila ananassae]|uniref:Uncharacterized protein n=1 Tax=Drosophila ananassae TaxID=7217 RepID=A0A0P8Y6P7_DROAN|nr:uncharacterized protein LOC26513653 [Drosophila ananassae]KPU77074.1 uncharacterized protein Dana_GF26244 [Drosophila ananassae]
MARFIFQFLLATLIVTIASSASYSHEETETIDFDLYDQTDSSLTKRSIASSISSEDNSSPEEEKEKTKKTLVVESSIDSDSAEESSPKVEKIPFPEYGFDSGSVEESSPKAEKTPNVKSSSDSDSAEVSQKSEEEVSQTRRRRSTNDVRYKNLVNLATICPTKKLENLEQGSFLDVKIEIRDMYKICKDLPNRHH